MDSNNNTSRRKVKDTTISRKEELDLINLIRFTQLTQGTR
jgi:hypothetical protein